MIKRLQNILSSTEPENKEVLWLHIFNGKVVQKLYLNGGWTSISSQGGGGGGDIDLSDYYTKPQVDSKFALKSALSSYVTTKTAQTFATKSDLNNYIKVGDITIPDLSNYYDKSIIDGKFADVGRFITQGYVKKEELKGYVYQEKLNEATDALNKSIIALDQSINEELSGVNSKITEVESKYTKLDTDFDYRASKAVEQDIYNATKDLPTKSYVQTVADNSVDQAVDGLATEKYVQEQIAENSGIEAVSQTATTATIQPNVLNVWGKVESLNLSFADGEEGKVNEYLVQFTSGATATTLVLPDTIQWMAAPNVQANKTYQLSVVNNLGIIAEFG